MKTAAWLDLSVSLLERGRRPAQGSIDPHLLRGSLQLGPWSWWKCFDLGAVEKETCTRRNSACRRASKRHSTGHAPDALSGLGDSSGSLVSLSHRGWVRRDQARRTSVRISSTSCATARKPRATRRRRAQRCPAVDSTGVYYRRRKTQRTRTKAAEQSNDQGSSIRAGPEAGHAPRFRAQRARRARPNESSFRVRRIKKLGYWSIQIEAGNGRATTSRCLEIFSTQDPAQALGEGPGPRIPRADRSASSRTLALRGSG
jgi:hypothetical protein